MAPKKLTLGAWLSQGPYTLALSSSFFGFFAHCGVTEALFEAGHWPQKITGASAGALVAGALSSGMSPQEARDLVFGISKRDFWDPFPGLGLLRGKKFQKLLESNYAPTFDNAGIPLEVAVFDVLACRTRFLHEGSLPRAILASCAVPFLFQPVRIGKRVYMDGGMFRKSGINPRHRDERLLCVFLQNDGLADSYERGRSLAPLGYNQKVLRLRNLPSLNYNSLDRGPAAYAEALRRTREALEGAFERDIVDF